MQIHATVVRWHNKGIVFTGKSGSGKSTAALLLMSKGAKLVADDQIILSIEKNKCFARCPETIKNKMEVRGVGIVDVMALKKTSVDLVVDLVQNPQDVPRMPIRERQIYENFSIPKLTLCAFDVAFCERLDMAIKHYHLFTCEKK